MYNLIFWKLYRGGNKLKICQKIILTSNECIADTEKTSSSVYTCTHEVKFLYGLSRQAKLDQFCKSPLWKGII